MPFVYKVETMPSGSATLTSWLNTQGAAKWELIQVIPAPGGGDQLVA
jgi:hypothetical protein